MKNVPDEGLRVIDQVEVDEADLGRLPDEVQLALSDIAGVAREGLLALSVTTGLAVLAEMMEAERTGLCGPVHAKDPDRGHVRGGGTQMSVVLGGRRVPMRSGSSTRGWPWSLTASIAACQPEGLHTPASERIDRTRGRQLGDRFERTVCRGRAPLTDRCRTDTG